MDKSTQKIITKPDHQIIVIDDQTVEATAMLQALYSRDPRSVNIHLERVKEVGAEKFMASYYVGYGHKSIGDCGTTTVFAENVSILAAKAIQDWRLYNGQEASTRYLDMQAQPVLNPIGKAEGEEIQKAWMSLYREILDELIIHLKEKFPKGTEEKEIVYDKAIKAKAFDTARGFLPAGVTTFASWHTNLRQAYDHIHLMQHHPLSEIRVVAENILTELKVKYPSSFSHKTYPEQEDYLVKSVAATSYYDREKVSGFSYESTVQTPNHGAWHDLLTSRPQKTELSGKFEKFGMIKFSYRLDFGSFRDMQRHRSGVNEMPLLSTKHGFFPWYLESLPEALRQKAEKVIAEQEKRIASLDTTPEEKQYYVALGYTCAGELTVGLPGAIYIAELRSSQTVHSTLRVVAQQMGNALAEIVPDAALYIDYSADEWNTKRGNQDIVKK